jgi:hypothetical protein
VNGFGSWETGSVNTLTLNLTVTFSQSYAGDFQVYATAENLSGLWSPWVDAGGYSVTTAASMVPVLSIAKSHSSSEIFHQGDSGLTYTVTVSNQTSAPATSGTVSVTEAPSPDLTVTGMSGSGWSCSVPACTRSDALSGGSSYNPITVTVNVASNANSTEYNAASVSGGGSAATGIRDYADVNMAFAPQPMSPVPSSGAVNQAPNLTLGWTAGTATSCNLYLGQSPSPSLWASGLSPSLNGWSYTPGALTAGATYYWYVSCSSKMGSGNSSTWSFSIQPTLTVSSITTSPASPMSGEQTMVQVFLSTPATGGGATATLQSSNLSIFPAPASVSFAAGSSMAYTMVTAGEVTAATNVTLTATYNGSSQNLVVTVIPAGSAIAPTFSPGTGTYSSATYVTISTLSPGTSIRYTTDGSTPSETTGTLYSGPVTVNSNVTLRAIAYELGWADSPVASAVYTYTGPGAPTLSLLNPGGGAQGSSPTVTLTGTNFVAGSSAVTTSNGAITVSGVTVNSATQITATFGIGASAATGAANVTVTTSGGPSNTLPFTVTAPVTISGPSGLPAGTVGTAYSATTASAAGGSGSYTWSVTGLPGGLTIGASTGTISGTPATNSGSPFSVVVTATDGNGATGSKSYTLTVNAAAPGLSITGPSSLPAGTAGTAYSNTTITATGGTAPYTWSATGLPAGLAIGASTGVIGGTPATNSGSPFSVVVTVTDANHATGTMSFSLTVSPGCSPTREYIRLGGRVIAIANCGSQ